MMQFVCWVFLSLGFSCPLAAADWPERLQKALPAGVEVVQVIELDEVGVTRVELTGERFLYVLPGGEYLLMGELVQLQEDGSLLSLTDQMRRQKRRARAAQLDSLADQAITFTPKGEPQAVVYVFTDIDCGYCRKFHSQIAKYNARGIEIRYLAWPRSGPGTQAYQKAQQAWCATDRKAALTALKRGGSVSAPLCDGAPIAAHHRLGLQLGVRGTPVLVTAEGRLIEGYQSPKQLVAKLRLN